MFENVWGRILEWFRDRSERIRLINSFNESAKQAFISGVAPTLLKARISRGDPEYKHQFSNLVYTGFRIQAFSGRVLAKQEIIYIGSVILDDEILIRTLIVLGWDTLEIHGDKGTYGCRWQLKDYLQLPNFNTEDNDRFLNSR